MKDGNKMISYVTVNVDEIEYYKNVAPDNKLKNLAAGGHYMIGAVDEDGNSLGAIGFEVTQEIYEEKPYINVNWLYIDENHRNKGYGTDLINETKRLSKDSGINDLRAEIPYPDTYNDITRFFQKNGFDFMFTDSYEFTALLSDLDAIAIKSGKVPKLETMPLSKVPLAIYNESILKLAKGQLGKRADRLVLDKAEYDQDMSMAYVDRGILKGVYLAKLMPDGTIESGNLFCVKENIGIISFNIVSDFIKAANKKCNKDTPFHIKCQRKASNKLMEFLLPNWIGDIVRKGRFYQ